MQVLDTKHLLEFKGNEISIAECVGVGSQGSVHSTSGDSDCLCAQHNFAVQDSQPWCQVSES